MDLAVKKRIILNRVWPIWSCETAYEWVLRHLIPKQGRNLPASAVTFASLTVSQFTVINFINCHRQHIKFYHFQILNFPGATDAARYFIYGVWGDVITAIKISFKLEMLKHFWAGIISCLVDCLPDIWFIWQWKPILGSTSATPYRFPLPNKYSNTSGSSQLKNCIFIISGWRRSEC